MSDTPPTVGAVFVASDDPVALARWYSDALGLPRPEGAGGVTGITVDGLYVGFEPREPDQLAPGRVTLWFAVADVTATHAALLGQGATERQPPTSTGREIVSRVADPEGNLVGLIGPDGAAT